MFTRQKALGTVLGAVATLVVPLIIGTTAVASATADTTYREWTLSGVTFDDGGTLSGTMIIASDGTPYDFDVTTSGGNTGVFGTINYSGTPSPLDGNGPADGWYLWAPGFGQYLNLLLPDTTSAHEGDSLPLGSPSWECLNCSPVRYITAGDIVAGDTVDVTPPEIDSSVDPTDPNGNHGWYTDSPTVSFSVSDPDSAITNESGCDTQTVDQDTDGTEITCSATSGGGTNSVSVYIQRDATPPKLKPTVSPAQVLLDGPINVTPNADDATSGVANQGCSASSHVAGSVVAKCHAVDLAGNSSTVKVRYTVAYVMVPLTVTGKHRPGHRLTVATRLTDANGHRISNDSAAALGCRMELHASGAQTHHACLTYDRSTHQFSSSWTLGKSTGQLKLRVSVSYPHSITTTTQTKTIKVSG